MKKLFLATPAFSGKVSLQYATSLAQTATLLDELRIPLQIHLAYATSLLVMTRNDIIQDFLKTDCTHLLCIDGNLEWQPTTILKWLDLDRDIIGTHEGETLPLKMFMIKRSVLEKVIKDTPHLAYQTKNPNRPIGHAFFSTEVINGKLASEEVYFSNLLRQSGFKLFAG